MSASSQSDFDEIKQTYKLDFDMLFCDETTLKTMVRSNPGIMTINKGTIEGKWSHVDYGKVKIKEGMGRKTVTMNFDLKDRMEKMFVNDQKYRSIITAKNPRVRDSLMQVFEIPKDSIGVDFWNKQLKLDSININLLDAIISKNGYPGKSLIGELNKDKAWSIIMHSNKVDKYIEQVKAAAEKNELTYAKAAVMEDLYLMNQGKEQLYGTQTYDFGEETIIWPIKDVEAVNILRRDAGFSLTVYEYAKELFGKDYIFEPKTLAEVKPTISKKKKTKK
jgi:hypothetical protein